MVKKNKVLIGCLSLLLVLSVGYALFSETITINGTATAKGSFDITTTCMPGYSDEFVNIGYVSSANEGQAGFENSTCNVNGNTVTMTTDLSYPTASRTFSIKMTNTGSIPALIWGATETEYFDSLEINGDSSYKLINNGTNQVTKSGVGGSIDGKYDYFLYELIVISDVGEINSNENIIYDSSKGAAAIKLNFGDSFIVAVTFMYPEDADRFMLDDGKSEFLQLDFDHVFKWEQYTDSPNYESTSFEDWCIGGC